MASNTKQQSLKRTKPLFQSRGKNWDSWFWTRPEACSIREMQMWVSDNVSSTCWRTHNSGHSVVQAQPLPMLNILDGCAEDGPLLTPALLNPKTINKGSSLKVHQPDGFGVSREGFGDGCIIAILKGAPALTSEGTNFIWRSVEGKPIFLLDKTCYFLTADSYETLMLLKFCF